MSAGKEEPLLKDEIMGSTPLFAIPNHQSEGRISRHCGVDATMRFPSRSRVIKLMRARASYELRSSAALCYRTEPLTKGKRVSLHGGIKKLDCERAILDRPALADELVEPMFGHRAFAVGVDVGAVAFAWR